MRDYDGIEQRPPLRFFTSVVIGGNDSIYESRRKYFDLGREGLPRNSGGDVDFGAVAGCFHGFGEPFAVRQQTVL